jgi:hypothetical protein
MKRVSIGTKTYANDPAAAKAHPFRADSSNLTDRGYPKTRGTIISATAIRALSMSVPRIGRKRPPLIGR